MEIVNTISVRDEIVEYLRRELVGPAPGFPAIQLNKEEMLRSQDPPRLRYSTGILFPLRSEPDGQLDIDEDALRGEDQTAPDDRDDDLTSEASETRESGGASDLQ